MARGDAKRKRSNRALRAQAEKKVNIFVARQRWVPNQVSSKISLRI